MTRPVEVSLKTTDLDQIGSFSGTVAVLIQSSGKLDQPARRINKLMKGALERFVESSDFEDMEGGSVAALNWPTGLAADCLFVVKLDRRASAHAVRAAGAKLGAKIASKDMLILAANQTRIGDFALGLQLRAYAYRDHKTDENKPLGAVSIMVNKEEGLETVLTEAQATVEGVFFTRDLVSAPANDLTTTEFANQLEALSALGVKVEVLDEPELEKLGMRTLLSVGQGSASPSKVVVMEWKGAEVDAPLALIGKGVVFDTGGISLKPAGGMEDMTMDMGGAGVVAGAMRTLALRKAKAHVVGLVGLVENMPSSTATRPGDVVKSMKGDTVEIINTDAEGRLVLADVLWYAQERFAPKAMVDLATLTGAVIIALGHENAGVFSNDDDFAKAFLSAAEQENEGAWRLPLGTAYDKQLKSQIADMKNVGGRPAGSVTAAQFLQRFVQEGTPWIHLDIAGVASVKSETAFAPKGATGWGVMALNRLVANAYEESAKEAK